MAETLKTQTLNIPNQVIDSDWKDDIDVGYATSTDDNGLDFAIYGDDETKEGEYISPSEVSKESIKRIKNRQIRLAFTGLRKFRQREQKELAKLAA